MPYWRLYYHLVWATIERHALITPAIEPPLYHYLTKKCTEQKGGIYAINGMPDHVHLVVSVPPTLALAEFIKKLKGSSSHYVSANYDASFQWQAGYGAFTISERTLSAAIHYVENQKTHHQQGTISNRLEYSSNKDEGPS